MVLLGCEADGTSMYARLREELPHAVLYDLFRVQITSKARIHTMVKPRFNFRSAPFDSIRFFCRITRLGAYGLCALANPALRAEEPRRLCGAIIWTAPAQGLFVTRRRVTVSGMHINSFPPVVAKLYLLNFSSATMSSRHVVILTYF